MNALWLSLFTAGIMLGQDIGSGLPLTRSNPDPLRRGIILAQNLGSGLANEFRKNRRMVENPAVHAYLDAVGQRVAGALPERSFPFHFEIFDEVAAKAVSYPFGYIFVPAPLILEARSEAELAAKLALAVARSASDSMVLQSSDDPPKPRFVFGQERDLVPVAWRPEWERREAAAEQMAQTLLARSGYLPASTPEIGGLTGMQADLNGSVVVARPKTRRPPSLQNRP